MTPTSPRFTPPAAAAATSAADDKEPASQGSSTFTPSNPEPICSVLNIVIDHDMQSATTLEPVEFRRERDKTNHGRKTPAALVPVLRVFGPIVRRDTGASSKPAQSACLYIHGAFPYLLARPRIAGPDGSLHPLRSVDRHINWDDPVAIQRILPLLQKTLEETILASSTFGKPAATSDKSSSHASSNPTKPSHGPTRPPAAAIIRKLTVELGRGFYSYCPGPPAPFLRVEYYNPSDRWKVKRALEHGLEVDTLFHPDPRQYATATGLGPLPVEQEVVLRFHCYEAHIPYTMQVFKDLNLAGMSYIHVANPRFRKLPAQRRQTFCLYQETPVDKEAMFLESNASEYLWPAQSLSSQVDSSISLEDLPALPLQEEEEISSASGLTPIGESLHHPVGRVETDPETDWEDLSQPPPGRETVCDVEVDVHASDILNVYEILTEPQADNVHWRAVPSLREVWAEEGERMAQLIPEATLAVPAAAQPGTRLAVEGMQRLMESSEDFLGKDYQRAVGQIIQRYETAIDEVDVAWQQVGEQGSPRSPADAASTTVSTPSFGEALDALAALRESPEDDQNGEDSDLVASQPMEVDAATSDVAPSPQPSLGLSLSPLRESLSQQQRFDDATQAYYQPKRLKPTTEREMTQRMERGEAVVDGPFRHVEDFLDSATLCPYELLEDEDSVEIEGDGMNEDAAGRFRRIESDMEVAATQTCQGKYAHGEGCYDIPEVPSDTETELLLAGTAKGEDGLLALEDSSDDEYVPHSHETETKETTTLSKTDSTYLQNPPSRKDIADADLMPLSARGQVPSWLTHTASYLRGRPTTETSDWFPEVGVGGVDVRLTRPAPTRRQVANWTTKDSRKRNTLDIKSEPAKRRRRGKGSAFSEQVMGGGQATTDPKDREVVAANDQHLVGRQQIEEVQWEGTQPVSQEIPSSQRALDEDAKPSQTGASHLLLGSQTSRHSCRSDDVPNGSSAGSYKSPTESCSPSRPSAESPQALQGIGNQGGRLWVEGGGTLKAKIRHSQAPTQPAAFSSNRQRKGSRSRLAAPVTIMSIETHVQCRTGRAGHSDSKQIAMVPNADRDKVYAVVYVFGKDPGGGQQLEILERGCLFVPVERELSGLKATKIFSPLKNIADAAKRAIPRQSMGRQAPLSVDCVEDERKLLLRLSAKVFAKNPDILVSWDPQASGLGYLIERGVAFGETAVDGDTSGIESEVDMARLLGRVRRSDISYKESDLRELRDRKKSDKADRWKGSGLGKDWDERVGPGVAAASIEGRLVFSARKLVAEEVKHPNSSYLQAVVSSVLGRRIPYHDMIRLCQWYGHDRGRERWRVLNHMLVEATASLLLLDALDIIGRAGEAARLSGVEFSQSFPGIRGSQYKVEGVLLRALKSLHSSERGSKKGRPVRNASSAQPSLSADTRSQSQSPWKARRTAQYQKASDEKPTHELSDRAYFFFSPSLDDTNRQEALEVQALTLEPESGHIEDPVVVCDFTALYPSLIIAYNLCFSTCAGQLEYHSTRGAMAIEGKTTGKVGPMTYAEDRTATCLKHHVKAPHSDGLMRSRVYVSPSRSIFVSESVVKGVLPQILDEMLSTRAMLKKAAKQYKRSVHNLSPAILRQLEARQLALKYVANVTYGYTSATFSGRCSMPLLADTIVECARRTLKNTVDLANEWGRDVTGKWFGCRCVYGDTDSVFVRLPGRTVKEAFQFGEALCSAVTRANPPPVQLKLEKVYLGSILQTKKKYCGMKFESPEQKKPTFESKGLETIRRDQCALTQKVLQNSLITLFTKGIRAVKTYLFRQWSLILSRSLPVSDFILTGRVRSRYRGDGIGPVQAVLARRLAESDPGRVVRSKERVAYVIVATPGVKFKLRDGVLTPMELLEQWDAFVLNTAYYITKHVNPALDRCLSLAPHKIDVASWFAACPKPRRRMHFWPVTLVGSNATLPRFFGSSICALCGESGNVQGSLKVAVCSDCKDDKLQSLLSAMERLSCVQRNAVSVASRCSRCSLTYEDGSTYATMRSVAKKSSKVPAGVATPLANCSCIDCPLTFERHRLREEEVEALEVCSALGTETDADTTSDLRP